MTENELNLLKRLVEIPSITGNEKAVGMEIWNILEREGVETRVFDMEPGRPIIIGIIRGKQPGRVLLYNGHTDTHPVAGYRGNPFDPVVKDGKLFGRGSVDMKGGLGAMLCAAIRLQKKRDQLGGTLVVAAVPDEELLSEGTAYLARMGIRADGGIVGEPTGFQIGTAMRGVTHIDITIEGAAGHTSRSSQEDNAIVQMAKGLAALDLQLPFRYGKRSHSLLGIPSYNVGMIKGGEKPNVSARTCSATLLRRDLPGEDRDTVFLEIHQIITEAVSKKCRVIVRESDIQKRPREKHRLPMEVEEDIPLVQVLKDVVEQVVGARAQTDMVPFWCDASILTNEAEIPTVVFGPGNIACAHSQCEWINLDQYEKGIEIYEKTALHFLSSVPEKGNGI